MKISNLALVVALGVLTVGATLCRAEEKAAVGKTAPAFTLPGSDGKSHSLADYKGKTIVLEWTNPGCPFVKKWYGGGAMQNLQKEATAKGTVWIRINSSAPGKEGYETKEQAAATDHQQKTAATATLLDPEGKVGRLYGAKTTPHMFVIDSKGTLVYEGAIDSIRSADPGDIPKATNYVTAALADLAAGKAVAKPSTQSYGCSVKYSDK